MIVNKYNQGGGGSSSAVTPQEVQQQIDSALTPYWESAQTESAITQAVSGLASEEYVQEALSGVNLENYYTSAQTEEAITSKNYVTSADVKTQVEAYNYMDQEDALVISTSLNDLEDKIEVISGRTVDLSGYYTSAQTEQAITSKNYVTSGDVKTQVEAYEYVNSGQVESQILAKNYLTAEDIEPDLIYSGNPGFYAINSSALTNWQIENLDLSNYNFVRFYVKASDIGFNDSDNFTAPLYVDVVLDPKSLSSQYQAYMGVTSNICAGNRNRSYHVIAAVDITKSKVQLLYQTTLWDISTSNANNNGRYCYKIEGYKYNVCGAAENGGGGEAYTAGANINISAANVISVSGLSTINGSAITAGGNIEIQAGGDMSAYWTSAETQSAITSVSGNLQSQIDTIDVVVSDALNDLNGRLNTLSASTVTSQDIRNIVKIQQTAYDTLVSQSATSQTTLYVVIPDAQ